MAVLDLTSKGRVSYVCGVGYRPEEYAMFGRDMRERGRRMETCLQALQRAWSGEPFEFEGRPVRVTPRPLTDGGPTMLMGGGSRVAVRRAARFGMGVLTQGGEASLESVYQAECEKLGITPGAFIHPPTDTVTCAFVAEDPNVAWQEIGPYVMHDARMYASWMGHRPGGANLTTAGTVAELRAQGYPYKIFTPEEAVRHIRTTGIFLAQPLCGGLPPEIAWKSLELLRSRVLPAVS